MFFFVHIRTKYTYKNYIRIEIKSLLCNNKGNDGIESQSANQKKNGKIVEGFKPHVER